MKRERALIVGRHDLTHCLEAFRAGENLLAVVTNEKEGITPFGEQVDLFLNEILCFIYE